MNKYKTAIWYQRLIGMIIDIFIITLITDVFSTQLIIVFFYILFFI